MAMQLAMASVNEQNRQDGLPDIEMGIGIHTGQVVVGNIGSAERTKYGVVGSQVNLTSRIQSCTTGGQTLISEATRREVGPILKLGKQLEIKAKGFEYPITVSEVLGIGRPYQLFLPDIAEELVPLPEEVPLTYSVIESNQAGGELCSGVLTKLSRKAAEARLESPVDTFSNLEMYFTGKEGESVQGTLYGKVVGSIPGTRTNFSICFTSVPPEVEAFLGELLVRAAEARPKSPATKTPKRRRTPSPKNGRGLSSDPAVS
jgi:adenylate cyclase